MNEPPQSVSVRSCVPSALTAERLTAAVFSPSGGGFWLAPRISKRACTASVPLFLILAVKVLCSPATAAMSALAG